MATPDTQAETPRNVIELIVGKHPEAEVEVRPVPGEDSLMVVAISYLGADGEIKTTNVRFDPNS